MGEEGDNVRMNRIEKDISLVQDDVKDVIPRLIRMEVNVEKILSTYTTIQNVCISLLVVNIAGILWVVGQ
jgi:hypothetical protein